MNPYNFVPIDSARKIERKPPAGHHKLSGLAGKIKCTVKAETPLIIKGKPHQSGAAKSLQNKNGDYIIPGSSLKGLIRNLVETVAHGCFCDKFDGRYEGNIDYRRNIPNDFVVCPSKADIGLPPLCIACRLFGWMNKGNIYTGKVFFSDAICIKDESVDHAPVYTIDLMGPKPRHSAFYLDEGKRYIAGRKYFYHSPGGIATQRQKSEYNSHLKPLGAGTVFNFELTFNNLEEDELPPLLYALVLEENMRHKIGYAKPAGLGSAQIKIETITIWNTVERYQTGKHNISSYDANKNAEELYEYINDKTKIFTSANDDTLNRLRTIWNWDPNSETTYTYPTYSWFKNPNNVDLRLDGTP